MKPTNDQIIVQQAGQQHEQRLNDARNQRIASELALREDQLAADRVLKDWLATEIETTSIVHSDTKNNYRPEVPRATDLTSSVSSKQNRVVFIPESPEPWAFGISRQAFRQAARVILHDVKGSTDLNVSDETFNQAADQVITSIEQELVDGDLVNSINTFQALAQDQYEPTPSAPSAADSSGASTQADLSAPPAPTLRPAPREQKAVQQAKEVGRNIVDRASRNASQTLERASSHFDDLQLKIFELSKKSLTGLLAYVYLSSSVGKTLKFGIWKDSSESLLNQLAGNLLGVRAQAALTASPDEFDDLLSGSTNGDVKTLDFNI